MDIQRPYLLYHHETICINFSQELPTKYCLWAWLEGILLLNWIILFGSIKLISWLSYIGKETCFLLVFWPQHSQLAPHLTTVEALFRKESGFGYWGFYWKARTKEDQRALYTNALCYAWTANLRLETRFTPQWRVLEMLRYRVGRRNVSRRSMLSRKDIFKKKLCEDPRARFANLFVRPKTSEIPTTHFGRIDSIPTIF